MGGMAVQHVDMPVRLLKREGGRLIFLVDRQQDAVAERVPVFEPGRFMMARRPRGNLFGRVGARTQVSNRGLHKRDETLGIVAPETSDRSS